MRRVCAGCNRELPYGSRQRYHSLVCRRLDNTLARVARERGMAPRALLVSLLNETGTTAGAAMRLGVDERSVKRWAHHLGIRRRWAEAVVYVPVARARQTRRRQPEGQLRLL